MILALALAFQAAPVLPAGWIKACATGEVQHCQVASLSDEDIYWVNVSVNHAIKPRPDREGEIERWEVFPDEGDCTAYTLSKRAALIALGVEPSRLTIVIGEHQRDGKWRRHMVLEVKLADRTWVLDNMTDKPYQPAKGPFQWRELARQSDARAVWK